MIHQFHQTSIITIYVPRLDLAEGYTYTPWLKEAKLPSDRHLSGDQGIRQMLHVGELSNSRILIRSFSKLKLKLKL
jgi:hypothetical protein